MRCVHKSPAYSNRQASGKRASRNLYRLALICIDALTSGDEGGDGFWLLQAEDTALLLIGEELGIASPVNGGLQL
ncbi:hypothetical protein KDAU_70760 [Dictyobacter aurantiacus]|uniref:Uncharacterized protein n=1 Tax=Dictyobacter aurantiacus TaxID=1936993 RepID=A0A401ZS86_9CHLR|nr:hypothetical protein KDAU_70760 [Dictyobacter aurantiacus]